MGMAARIERCPARRTGVVAVEILSPRENSAACATENGLFIQVGSGIPPLGFVVGYGVVACMAGVEHITACKPDRDDVV